MSSAPTFNNQYRQAIISSYFSYVFVAVYCQSHNSVELLANSVRIQQCTTDRKMWPTLLHHTMLSNHSQMLSG